MDFGEKGQGAEAHQENVLNLPYSDFEEEQGEDASLALQIVPFTEALSFPTPQEQEKPAKRASSSKLGSQKINKLLRQVYEMEVFERQLKRNNETLTRRNKLLHKSYLDQREKRLNNRYLKDNTRLLKIVRLQRL